MYFWPPSLGLEENLNFFRILKMNIKQCRMDTDALSLLPKK